MFRPKDDSYKDLYEKYPFMFAGTTMTPMESRLSFGVECGPGWKGLISLACEKLDKIEGPMGVKLDQVKEKFGTLQIYFHFEPRDDVAEISESETLDIAYERADEIVMGAEIESGRICEVCGKPGEVIGRGWLMCRCRECREKKH